MMRFPAKLTPFVMLSLFLFGRGLQAAGNADAVNQASGNGSAVQGNKPNSDPVKTDTITKNGYTLYFIDKDQSFTTGYKQRFVDAFFRLYPTLTAKYNRKSPAAVTFRIDKAYTGVAATGDDVIHYNPAWFAKNPEDIDVVTHELMHVVQAYGSNEVPGWVTEGIADYVRATEGINNEGAKWRMPDPRPGDSYTKSYRIAARFFLWISQRYKNDFVQKLDAAARQKAYSADTWKNLTGKTVDDLWQEYSADPVVKP